MSASTTNSLRTTETGKSEPKLMWPLNKPKGNTKTFQRATDAFWERRRAGYNQRQHLLSFPGRYQTLTRRRPKHSKQALNSFLKYWIYHLKFLSRHLSEPTRVIIIVLFFSQFHKKNTQGGDQHCEAINLNNLFRVCLRRTDAWEENGHMLGQKKPTEQKRFQVNEAKNRTYIFWNKRPTIALSCFAPWQCLPYEVFFAGWCRNN